MKKQYVIVRKYAVLLLLPLLAACATAFDGSTQRIKIEVVGIEDNKLLNGARCTITDEMESVFMLSDNPGSIKVRKGQGTLQFDCKKPGYVQKNMFVQETFNNTAIFNVFTLGIGFFLDAVSGAILEYPSHVVIRMEQE